MSLSISVEHLSKQYRLGLIGSQTLREDFNRWWARMRGRPDPLRKIGQWQGKEDMIWALRDVTFQVEQGEAVGIIGANGAGKSTLLKILSRVTEPTSGVAKMKGRVASLLEVGAGFHPELTGRENIFLNGVILGMRKSEISRRFDEIVTFSEIEKFIETPVKHYSNGMYVRLAFAVAAFVEADILLVDEALAVGDAAFQKKCMTKMQSLASSGRTVFYVSHNLSAIEHLCQNAYLLDKGRIVSCGDTRSVIEAYYKLTFESEEPDSEVRRVPEGTARFVGYEINSHSGNNSFCTYPDAPCDLTFFFHARRVVNQANFGLALWGNDGTLLWAMRSLDYGGKTMLLKEGLYALLFRVPSLPLKPGSYQLHISANDLVEGTLDVWYAKPKLQVLARRESGLPPQWQGILNLDAEFQLNRIEEDAKLRKAES